MAFVGPAPLFSELICFKNYRVIIFHTVKPFYGISILVMLTSYSTLLKGSVINDSKMKEDDNLFGGVSS